MQRFYRPELDVLRFLAFLLVFLYHAFPAQGRVWIAMQNAGALGVCLFFLLSSYLITELLQIEQEASGTIRLGAFYIRRTLRIWPLYFAVLLLDFFILHYTHPGVFTGTRLAAFLLLAGNWYVALHGFTFSISTPLWSISVEEQFYVIWPSVRKYFNRRGSLVLSLLTLVAAYYTLYQLCRHDNANDPVLWVSSLVQFQFFGIGALLAIALKRRTPHLHRMLRLVLLATGLLLLFIADYRFHVKSGMHPASFPVLATGYLCTDAGCIAIFLSVLGAQRLGRLKPLTYLGSISYGLYVYHWIVLRLVLRFVDTVWTHMRWAAPETPIVVVLTLALTILCAALSYRFFESPILRLKKRFEVVRSRPT